MMQIMYNFFLFFFYLPEFWNKLAEPETDEMCQFLAPERDPLCQFLEPCYDCQTQNISFATKYIQVKCIDCGTNPYSIDYSYRELIKTSCEYFLCS